MGYSLPPYTNRRSLIPVLPGHAGSSLLMEATCLDVISISETSQVS